MLNFSDQTENTTRKKTVIHSGYVSQVSQHYESSWRLKFNRIDETHAKHIFADASEHQLCLRSYGYHTSPWNESCLNKARQCVHDIFNRHGSIAVHSAQYCAVAMPFIRPTDDPHRPTDLLGFVHCSNSQISLTPQKQIHNRISMHDVLKITMLGQKTRVLLLITQSGT